MKTQGFDISEYEKFSINEIDAMYVNAQLDMLVTRASDNRKTYIKYHLDEKQIRRENLDQIIEDLYMIENVLEKTDSVIIISNEEPNETILAKLVYLYDRDGIFVNIINIKRLQFNILNHRLVPPISIVDETEVTGLMQRLNLKSLSQLPEISRFDPQAMAIGLRPKQICLIKRNSSTALEYNFYRVCV
jgi:DNA-directed RNA polymerase subunit H (RpoH/RPB5)